MCSVATVHVGHAVVDVVGAAFGTQRTRTRGAVAGQELGFIVVHVGHAQGAGLGQSGWSRLRCTAVSAADHGRVVHAGDGDGDGVSGAID
ncbi:hypothetical protein PVL97_20920 [Aeromonas hydrophila]|uniref:hypothetical protein n=1 Tax=Aeromonas hydrophila TaxID=644 RepID=UPI00237832CF|nr:hypothetical protein [Aeromonas hydrophila]MDD9232069.1 hypothetical protein [Aeromonas hydrophila]